MGEKKNRKERDLQKKVKDIVISEIRPASKKIPWYKDTAIVIAGLALLVSFLHFVFDNPYFLRMFNETKIAATATGIFKTTYTPSIKTIELDSLNEARKKFDNYVTSQFIIQNIGSNTEKKLEFHLRVLKDDQISIFPNSYEKIREDNHPRTPYKDLVYRMDQFVGKEAISISVTSDFAQYLKVNRIDTLEYNKPISRPISFFGPDLFLVKYSGGFTTIENRNSIELKQKLAKIIN